MNYIRRRLMLWMLAASLLGPIAIPPWLRKALAMGQKDFPQGMQTVEGDVRINNMPAETGSLVNVGDVVTTGEDGYAVFVMQRSAYMVRENSRIEISAVAEDEQKEKMILILAMINGSLLSVFGKGKRRIVTPTAIIGIRGTAVYVESEPTRAYVCTCYGRASIESRIDRRVKETIKTRHHEKPRWVYGEGADELLVEAPVINHTDDELILLESLVGRRPPFVKAPGYGQGSSGY